MAISVIVELQAKPGMRRTLERLLEDLIATQGSGVRGFLGSKRYEVLDNPDLLVEIAEWESVEARQAHMQEALGAGTYAPVLELLAAPFRVTLVRQMS
jgi:quinol monooxygenase YgiN